MGIINSNPKLPKPNVTPPGQGHMGQSKILWDSEINRWVRVVQIEPEIDKVPDCNVTINDFGKPKARKLEIQRMRKNILAN